MLFFSILYSGGGYSFSRLPCKQCSIIPTPFGQMEQQFFINFQNCLNTFMKTINQHSLQSEERTKWIMYSEIDELPVGLTLNFIFRAEFHASQTNRRDGAQ